MSPKYKTTPKNKPTPFLRNPIFSKCRIQVYLTKTGYHRSHLPQTHAHRKWFHSVISCWASFLPISGTKLSVKQKKNIDLDCYDVWARIILSTSFKKITEAAIFIFSLLHSCRDKVWTASQVEMCLLAEFIPCQKLPPIIGVDRSGGYPPTQSNVQNVQSKHHNVSLQKVVDNPSFDQS